MKTKPTLLNIGDDNLKFLDKSINMTKTHLKSRSAIVRFLIEQAKKDKKLLNK